MAKINRVEFPDGGQFWSDASLFKPNGTRGSGWKSVWVVFPDQTIRLVTYNTKTSVIIYGY